MALSKLDKTSEDHKMLETFDDEWAIVLRDLIDKVNTGFDKTNEHINKVASMQTEINTEKNKTGISTAQANAITANTAKTGITSDQIGAIAKNTTKVGITTAQADAITANTAKVGMTTKQSQQLTLAIDSMIQLTSAVKGTTVATPTLTLIAGKASGTYSIRLSFRVTPTGSKTQVLYVDLPLR